MRSSGYYNPEMNERDNKFNDIGEKVKHVVKAGQTRDHHCHWPNCKEQCPPAKWGCRTHWYKLPQRIRHRIWLTYRVGQEVTMSPSREYIAAAREAQDWIKANYPNG